MGTDPDRDPDRGREHGGEAGDGDPSREDPESAARIICLRLLEHRARTRAELEQALSRRGVPDDAAATVLDRLAAVGLVDDAAFAGQFVESRRTHRGLSRRAISTQLRVKGVADDVAELALSSVTAEDEWEAARMLAEVKLRRMRGVDPTTVARRLVGLLARRGYSAGMAFAVVRDVLDRSGVPDVADAVDIGDVAGGDGSDELA